MYVTINILLNNKSRKKYMKKAVLLSLLIAGLFAAKKADYAKVLSSDIQSTIIEFKLNDFNLVPVQTSDGIMHLARL